MQAGELWDPRREHESQCPRIPDRAELPRLWARRQPGQPSVERSAALGRCSQHQDVPKHSWGLVSTVPSALWLLPVAASEAHSVCPLGTPCGCWGFYPCLFFSPTDDLLFLGPSLDLKPPPLSAGLEDQPLRITIQACSRGSRANT